MIHLAVNRDFIASIHPKCYFTKLEAYIDLLIQVDEGREVKVFTLASRWGWSRTKTKAFLDKYNDFKKDGKKDTRKNSEKDTEKNIVVSDEIAILKSYKDSEKDTEKSSEKDTEKNMTDVNLNSINEILGM